MREREVPISLELTHICLFSYISFLKSEDATILVGGIVDGDDVELVRGGYRIVPGETRGNCH